MSSPAAAINAAAFGPAAGFPNVDEGELGLREILRDLLEQRRFLGAGNRDRRAVGKGLLKSLKLEAAELVGLRDPCRAAAADCLRVERHGLLAAADQEMRRSRTHCELP